MEDTTELQAQLEELIQKLTALLTELNGESKEPTEAELEEAHREALDKEHQQILDENSPHPDYPHTKNWGATY